MKWLSSNIVFYYRGLACLLFILAITLLQVFCTKDNKVERASYGNFQGKKQVTNIINPNDFYADSAISAAKRWLVVNKLPNLIPRFEEEQKEKAEIDHSLNYSPGYFLTEKISTIPLKLKVSYVNSSTNSIFIISWIADFSVHRIYANPNEYGYDKEGVQF